jgi:SAM-dependent methyltransferase
MTPAELQAKAEQYRWYHPIDLGGYVTKPDNDFSVIWDFIRQNLSSVDFQDKTVLDIGCRDGLWSLFAESRGALLVGGIDNNISKGAIEFALPHLKSQVAMHEANICSYGSVNWDIVLMMGLLYHLRMPMLGLFNACECLKKGGLLCIETAIHAKPSWHDTDEIPMLYCPFLDSPYEAGSISFFNRLGLTTTLESMGMKFISYADLPESQVGPVRRAFFKFEKGEMYPHLREYWTGTHTGHTSASEKAWQEEAKQRHVSQSP